MQVCFLRKEVAEAFRTPKTQQNELVIARSKPKKSTPSKLLPSVSLHLTVRCREIRKNIRAKQRKKIEELSEIQQKSLRSVSNNVRSPEGIIKPDFWATLMRTLNNLNVAAVWYRTAANKEKGIRAVERAREFQKRML